MFSVTSHISDKISKVTDIRYNKIRQDSTFSIKVADHLEIKVMELNIFLFDPKKVGVSCTNLFNI